MKSTIDVREIANEMLARAKDILQVEGTLPPTGYALEATGKLTAVKLDLSDKEAKKQAAHLLGRLQRDARTIAVITIKDSMYRCFPREGEAPPNPSEGPERPEIRADGKPRPCIFMEVKVPGLIPTIVMVPYSSDSLGNIEFGAHEEAPLDFVGSEPPSDEEEESPKN